MRKYKFDYSSGINYYGKPTNFKFVRRSMIYSCDIHIRLLDSNRVIEIDDRTINNVHLEYKLDDKNKSKIDDKWVNNYYFSIFGRDVKYNINVFKRDGAPIAFIHEIYLSQSEVKKYLRSEKLKRILEL